MILPGSIFTLREDFRIDVGLGLVILNCLVYLVFGLTMDKEVSLSQAESSQQRDSYEKLRQLYHQTLDPLERQVNSESYSVVEIMRDSRFWKRAETFPFIGDQVEIQKYRENLKQVKSDYESSVQYKFGLSPKPTSIWAWITYQFTHASFIHLLSNLIFLFFVARLVEARTGSGWLLMTYVLGGLGGGVGFLALNTGGDVAVLGASGSICALIGFLAVISNRHNIVWSYFFSPFKNGYGLIYMPAFLLFPIYLMSDFTSILYHSSGVEMSVAHSAHVGGTLVGLALGAIYLLDQAAKKFLLQKWSNTLGDKEILTLRSGLAEYQELSHVQDENQDDDHHDEAA